MNELKKILTLNDNQLKNRIKSVCVFVILHMYVCIHVFLFKIISISVDFIWWVDLYKKKNKKFKEINKNKLQQKNEVFSAKIG